MRNGLYTYQVEKEPLLTVFLASFSYMDNIRNNFEHERERFHSPVMNSAFLSSSTGRLECWQESVVLKRQDNNQFHRKF